MGAGPGPSARGMRGDAPSGREPGELCAWAVLERGAVLDIIVGIADFSTRLLRRWLAAAAEPPGSASELQAPAQGVER